MHISFSPQRRDDTLIVVRQGDTLTINGDLLDFTSLPDGATLPAGAAGNDWVVGPVHRIDGALHITLLWPYQKSGHVEAPDPITNPPDGPIALPTLTEEVGHDD